MPINSPNLSFIKPDTNGVKLFLRVTPKAKKEVISGIFTDSDGQEYLKLFTNAPPIDNAANTAIIKALAKLLRIPTGSFAITSGLTSRKKVVSIANIKESEIRNIICPHP